MRAHIKHDLSGQLSRIYQPLLYICPATLKHKQIAIKHEKFRTNLMFLTVVNPSTNIIYVKTWLEIITEVTGSFEDNLIQESACNVLWAKK